MLCRRRPSTNFALKWTCSSLDCRWTFALFTVSRKCRICWTTRRTICAVDPCTVWSMARTRCSCANGIWIVSAGFFFVFLSQKPEEGVPKSFFIFKTQSNSQRPGDESRLSNHEQKRWIFVGTKLCYAHSEFATIQQQQRTATIHTMWQWRHCDTDQRCW